MSDCKHGDIMREVMCRECWTFLDVEDEPKYVALLAELKAMQEATLWVVTVKPTPLISRYVAVWRDSIRLEPDAPEDWRVIRLDSDGDGEYVRSGPRDYCEDEAARLNDLVLGDLLRLHHSKDSRPS